MIEKKISPKGKSATVTFELPADAASEGVAVVGDFNDWSQETHPMKLSKKEGVWKKKVSGLKPGSSYQFRYLVDGEQWRNDEAADGYVPTPYFSDNCVVEV